MDGGNTMVHHHGAAADAACRHRSHLPERAFPVADRPRRQSEVLATVAHELGNVLLPLRLAARSLREAQDRATLERLQATISSQVDCMARLIGELADRAALDGDELRLQCARVDLAEALATAASLCRPAMEARGHHFTCCFGEGALAVRGDRTRLIQVFLNLLQNAAKYTPDGGWVCVEASSQGALAVVRVVDNGIGISASALPHLFEMYTREAPAPGSASVEGRGIGLAVVRELVQAHGGTVQARSQGKGAGSEFVVQLPLQR